MPTPLSRLRFVLAGLCTGLALAAGMARAETEFLDPAEAFGLHAERVGAHQVRVHWDIAPGYLLYQKRVHLRVDGAPLTPRLPSADLKPDPASGEQVAVYHQRLELLVDVPDGARNLGVDYQGCAEAGLCYPPQQRVAALTPAARLDWTEDAAPVESAPPAGVAATADDGVAHRIQAALAGGSALEVMGVFLLAGLLLSFTPCVLPMVPILSAILVGQQAATRRRGLQLALSYSLGMAVVYTALGMAAGLAGEGLAGFLQQPAVLAAFAALLALLSLSMFDVYTLQVPAGLQTRLASWSDRFGGGAVGGAAVMGALSALMVGPCVAAPLAGALLYIGQTHDMLLGGLALFALAIGMSAPLLLTGVSAGSLLPRAGAWMTRVKHVFGLLLLAVAWSMVAPLLNPGLLLAGWGLLALAGASFLGLHDTLPAQSGAGARVLRVAAMSLAIVGALEIVGSVSGAGDAMSPLSRLAGVGGTGAAPHFTRIDSVDALQRAVAEAVGQSGKPVLLDIYADWCTACKEMERDTFADPAVQRKLRDFTLLRADVTANSPAQRALQKHFGLFGPPGLIFFDAGGQEMKASRVVGFMESAQFLGHLTRAAPAAGRSL